jgi:uncharacterized protein Smg (DUF494 family)
MRQGRRKQLMRRIAECQISKSRTTREQWSSIPQATVSPGDVQALESMVMGYLAYLRKTNPSAKQSQIRVLEGVCQRLAHHSEGILVPFTREELDALEDAMAGFVMVMRQVLPLSKEREEVIESIQGLYQHLAVLFSPYLD